MSSVEFASKVLNQTSLYSHSVDILLQLICTMLSASIYGSMALRRAKIVSMRVLLTPTIFTHYTFLEERLLHSV